LSNESTKPNHLVNISGNLLPGFDRENAIEWLMKTFKMDEDKATKCLNGVSKVVKKCSSDAEADRYLTALNRQGIEATTEKIESGPIKVTKEYSANLDDSKYTGETTKTEDIDASVAPLIDSSLPFFIKFTIKLRALWNDLDPESFKKIAKPAAAAGLVLVLIALSPLAKVFGGIWYDATASIGFAGSQFQVGKKHDKNKDYDLALKWYQLAANQGDSDAQYNLGVLYDEGNGTAQDYKTALKWYQLAADQGHSYAQYNLGVLYDEGNVTAQDYRTALEWYQLSANQGDSDAQYYKTALKWYQLAADQGDSVAQYNMGVMYNNGNGTAQNYEVALRWFQLAADQGLSNAQNSLGDMYYFGTGTAQNYEVALKWYQLAADQGLSNAQKILGDMYYVGYGTAQNYEVALKWYQLASYQGSQKAIDMVRLIKSLIAAKEKEIARLALIEQKKAKKLKAQAPAPITAPVGDDAASSLQAELDQATSCIDLKPLALSIPSEKGDMGTGYRRGEITKIGRFGTDKLGGTLRNNNGEFMFIVSDDNLNKLSTDSPLGKKVCMLTLEIKDANQGHVVKWFIEDIKISKPANLRSMKDMVIGKWSCRNSDGAKVFGSQLMSDGTYHQLSKDTDEPVFTASYEVEGDSYTILSGSSTRMHHTVINISSSSMTTESSYGNSTWRNKCQKI
jgi:TPR repeat protein